MTTTTYATKALAITAARTALKGQHKDPMCEVHFRISQAGEEFGWHQIDIDSGMIATGELIADGAAPASPPLPTVTKIPAKGLPVAKIANDTRSPARKKADAKAQKAGHPNATRQGEAKRTEAAAQAGKANVKAATTPKKATGKRAEVLAAAQAGKMPTAPDFSAETHKRFRKTLAELVAFAKAGNIKGLKGVEINPISSSRISMDKYRNLCVIALEAKKKADKAPAAPRKAVAA